MKTYIYNRNEDVAMDWMMGIKMIAKIRKEIRAGEANISEKIREARLRWFGHVTRKTAEEL